MFKLCMFFVSMQMPFSAIVIITAVNIAEI